MKDSNFVRYTFELQKKEKENANKNQISEEYNGCEFKKDQDGEYKMQTGQIKKNEGSTSKRPIKEGKDAYYHVQQGIRVDSSNTIDLTITSLDKSKEKSYKKVIQNERSKEYNESKKIKERVVSFEEERFEKQQQQQQQQEDINDEFELNILTSSDSLPDNTNHILKDNNIDSDSKLPINDETDQNYYRLKQGVPRSTKFHSIIDIYKHTKRLSSSEQEYNWSCLSTLEKQKSEVHNEGKMGKDQVNTIKEILPNKQKQKIIHGDFESLGEHRQEDNSNHILMEDNIDNRSNLSMKEKKDEDDHLNKGLSESTLFKSLFDLGEVIIQYETSRSEVPDGSITRKDHEDSIEEEQQQQPNNIIGEDSLPKINPDCVLNGNDANCGSKLLTRDENGGNYRITQGLPRSIKFRSISNLYECTTRLSPVEDEYNWNLRRGEDSIMNHLKKEDSSGKKNFGCKRKCRENQKGKGIKDATT
ncbi:uncharacterized protein LOC129885230 [Solanum dulcamara]|uniref:uncharacterized protein LOC129885230 n=1 Tax=Solanum dulcamara TaxID=45834 RepID=UPI0024851575|nr:uncharacterized protein LOC129885230 [Solanum dulcamara]